MSPTAPRSWLAVGAAVVAALGAVDLLLGPALAMSGLVRPFTAFLLFASGLLQGLVALVLGALGVLHTRAGSGRSGRGLALAGLAAGALITGAGVLAALPGRGVPRINDITTQPDDPPAFVAAARDPANAGRDLAYPPGFAAQQRAGYPDLAPFTLAVPPDQALERSQRAVQALGWDLVEIDVDGGRVEAREVSTLFRFVDDVVVRVRPAPGGSVVDVRSKSRDGQGDLGANAARIRAFGQALAD